LLETEESITSKLAQIFSDAGEEKARHNRWYKEYRKRGEDSMRGTYELIISVHKGYGNPYYIEYSDKTGIELKISAFEIKKEEFGNKQFDVTPDYVVWWESSTMKERTKYFDKIISSCYDSFDCRIPHLF